MNPSATTPGDVFGPGLADGACAAPTGSELQARLCVAMRGTTLAEASRRIGFNSETVRRYCRLPGGRPSLEFILAVCEEWDVNANWLLFGIGSPRGRDLRSQVLASLGNGAAGSVRIRVGTLSGGDSGVRLGWPDQAAPDECDPEPSTPVIVLQAAV